MKSLTKAGLALVLIVAFYACKKDIETTDPMPTNAITLNKKGDTIIHKLNINGNTTYVNEINGEYYYADDIIISREQFNTLKRLTAAGLSTQERSTIVSDFAKTWPKAVVYYRYPDKNMTTKEHNKFINSIDQAIKTISEATGIKFVERTNQSEYIQYVTSGSSNNSDFGWQANRVNRIKMKDYDEVSVAIHETLHSLAITHEQCRPDRDQYIRYYPDRVEEGHEHNFNITTSSSGHGAFDFQSIMLYWSTGFAIDDDEPVLTRLDGTTWGVNDKLSAGDVAGLKALYFPTEASGQYKISPVYASNRSIDVYQSSTANGTYIVISTPTTGNNQKFIFRKTDHGYYQIKSQLDTTKVLTVRNASANSGTYVELRTNTSGDHQKFKLYNRGVDGFSFAPKHATGLRLAVNQGSSNINTTIVVNTSDTNAQSQRFNLTKQ